jgi:hypothetical protein
MRSAPTTHVTEERVVNRREFTIYSLLTFFSYLFKYKITNATTRLLDDD